MPLPSEVREYVEQRRRDGGKPRTPPSDGSISRLAEPHSADYMRGYVGAGRRMSGEEADGQLMELMKNW